MSKNSAQIRTESPNPSGQEAHMERTPSTWTSVPRDEEYEKRIFELECHIDQIEYQLVLAEIELCKCKREHCA